MAHAIRRRYARVGLSARAATLILVRARALNSIRVQLVRPLTFSPQLSFHFAFGEGSPTALHRASPREPERVLSFVRVLTERRTRTTSVVEPARSSRPMHLGGERASSTDARLRRAQPVECVLPRSPRAISSAESSPPRLPEELTVAHFPPLRAPAAAQLTPPDVNRLADEVLRTIDKRIVAHRERMGRR
jgi:hypothetical protein